MHLSDVKKFIKCQKLYQLSLFEKTNNFQFFNINVNIDDTIKEKLNISNCYFGEIGDSNEKSISALKKNDWLFRLRFEYRGLRIKIPVIHKTRRGTDIYFISLATSQSSDDINTYKWHIYVLEKCGIKIRNIFTVYLNVDYVREDKLDGNKLWIVTDRFREEKIKNLVSDVEIDVDNILDRIEQFDINEEIYPERGSKCTRGRKCPYYDFCFPIESLLPDNSILNLVNSQYKYQMYDHGIAYLRDAQTDKLEGSMQQYAQIMADKNGGLYCDKSAINHFLNELKYPISYVDFEWDLFPIPPYHGMKPLDVLVFQYALDVDDGKKINHYQFIGEEDSRKEFLEHLLENLPKEGSIIAYNATGAEILRLKELAIVYPQYREEIENVISRFVDLAIPFMRGSIYDIRMKGLYSLKSIESVIDPKHNYHDLDIENGLQAVEIHRLLSTTINPDLKEEYYNHLYEYCNLDSSSMVRTINWLRNIVK